MYFINDHLHGNSGKHDIKLSVLYADAADMISPEEELLNLWTNIIGKGKQTVLVNQEKNA